MTQVTARFERIKARPAYEMVAEEIERQILSGTLRPGDPIGTESELVRQFGVNRSTVREGHPAPGAVRAWSRGRPAAACPSPFRTTTGSPRA